MAIEYRRLGASGLMVSPLCLGTMMFGDRTDAATSRKIVDSAFDAGINFIDTADVYKKALRGDRRRGDQGAPSAVDSRDESRQRDDRQAARRRPVARAGSISPATTASRGSPPTTSISTICTRTIPTRRSPRPLTRSAT
jgi:hypothetical protein